MKQITIIVAVLLILSANAMAQDEKIPLPDPGTTPDSMLYFLDVVLDNLALALTLNDDAKIEKQLEIAEERLAEAREMAEIGDVKAMQRASDEHGQILSKLKADLREIENSDSEGELRKEIEIERKIELHGHNVEDVKNELKTKIEIEGELTDEQWDQINSILTSLEGQTGEISIEIKNEKEKTKIKIEQETGKDGDEAEIEIEDELGITEAQRDEAREEIIESREDLKELLAEYPDIDEALIDEINNTLNEAEAAFDDGRYEDAEEMAEEAEDLIEELEERHHESDDDDTEEHTETETEHTETGTVEHTESETEHTETGTEEHTETETEHTETGTEEHTESEMEHTETETEEHKG